MIDRSHRVGKKGDDYCRPIICKFTSHRYNIKQRLVKEKKKLSKRRCEAVIFRPVLVPVNVPTKAAHPPFSSTPDAIWPHVKLAFIMLSVSRKPSTSSFALAFCDTAAV
ncbi:hypothetical protein BaRGS_00011331 [Batillaria attramentaria]|uniref:Uncharacterized protein n=1 Tax=Batillaria attramentaria TaxID=370345 RepID=A0ABD0LD50_9CAEN